MQSQYRYAVLDCIELARLHSNVSELPYLQTDNSSSELTKWYSTTPTQGCTVQPVTTQADGSITYAPGWASNEEKNKN